MTDSFDATRLRSLLAAEGFAEPPASARSELELWDAATRESEFWNDGHCLGPGFDAAPASFEALVRSVPDQVHGCAVMAAFFSGCRFLTGQEDDDEQTCLVALAAGPDGAHHVYAWNPRHLVFENKGWPSICAFLANKDEGEALEPRARIYEDPVHLSRRSAWLTAHFAGVGFRTVALDTEHAARADDYPAEQTALSTSPHLALYWLLHHYAAHNEHFFRDVLERAGASEHPWLQEVVGILGRGDGERLRLGPKRIAELEAASPQIFATGSN